MQSDLFILQRKQMRSGEFKKLKVSDLLMFTQLVPRSIRFAPTISYSLELFMEKTILNV